MISTLRAAICGISIMLPGVLSAATLTATFDGDFMPVGWDGATDGTTAFEIQFDDSLGTQAGVLEGSEFLSFTWINNPFMSGGSAFRELLANAPTVAGVVETFRPAGFPGTPNASIWGFGQSVGSATGGSADAMAFTYSITGLPPQPDSDPNVIPLPASLPILGSGLIGLIALGRRRKSAA